MTHKAQDDRYFQLIAKALQVCAKYKPMFGQGRKGGLTLEQFRRLYRADPFYSWIGLDSPLMYAAHKAAGGMTSIYRQLGMGTQWVFANVLMDTLRLSLEQSNWSYEVPMPSGKPRLLSLDGRIELEHVEDPVARVRLQRWLDESASKVLVSPDMRKRLKGAVFEVRQGYKSKDSKRQNADISNATNAYTHFYLPVLFLLSTQIDGDVSLRYTQAQWLLLTGTTDGSPTESAYVFCRDVVGYDLAAFFKRNSDRIKTELEKVLKALLEADK